jgi:PAS domain S-box-containing protein
MLRAERFCPTQVFVNQETPTMNVTTTSAQTHNWDVLAQLALYGQRAPAGLDTQSLIQQLADLIRSYLPHPWGVLASIEAGQMSTWAAWGLPDDEAARIAQWNGEGAHHQSIAYPLYADNEEVGVLRLGPTSGPHAATNQQFYQALAAQLGLLVRARQQAAPVMQNGERRPPGITQAQRLERIGQDVATARTTPEMLEHIAASLTVFFPVDAYTIAFYSTEYDELTATLTMQDGEQAMSTVPLPPQPNSVLAQVLESRAPILNQDAASSSGAWLGMPLLTTSDELLGALVLHRPTPGMYAEHEQMLLRAVAGQVALSVQNGRLLEHTREQVLQLDLINHVSSVVASTHEMETVYRAVLDTMVQATGVDQAGLMLYDREAGTGTMIAEQVPTGGVLAGLTIELDNGPIFAWLDAHMMPLVAPDALREKRFDRWKPLLRKLNIGSLAIVPLRLGESTIGNIILAYVGRRAHFRTQHLTFCQTVANHVATVIEKDQLFEQAQENARALEVKVGELSTLLESAGILGSLLQPEDVLKSLTDLVSRQLRVASVALWTIRGEVLVPTALYGLNVPNPDTLHLPIGEGLTGSVAESGLPLIIHDIHEYRAEHHPGFFGQDNGMTSYMGVPIFYRDRVIGVLSVMSAERREFNHDEKMLLMGLAGQAAVALENARLFQERERRIAQLTTINQISAAVNATLELDDLLLVLAEGIGEVLDTTWSFIGLYEEVRFDIDDSLICMRVMRNGGDLHLSTRTVSIDGRGLIDGVVLKFEPLLIQSADNLAAYVREHRVRDANWELNSAELSALDVPFASCLSVPIVQGGHVLGVVHLQHEQPYAYDEDDQSFLSTVASQAAVAISNARLFEERERRLRELSVLKDISSAISATMDLRVMLENLRHELGQAIDISTSMFGLYDEKTDLLTATVCYDRGRPIHLAPTTLADDASASGWVVQNRQPLLLHTLEQCRQLGFDDFGFSMFDIRSPQTGLRLPEIEVAQSFLVVPILAGDTVLGVINIQSYTPYAFDQDDLRFVLTVANQTAVTISNVHLFIERGRRIEELATFNEMIRALSSTVNLDELPDLIYEQTSRLLDTTNFALALVDSERNEVRMPLLTQQGKHCPVPDSYEESTLSSEGGYAFPVAPEGFPHWEMLMHLTWRVINLREPLLMQGKDLPSGEWVQDMWSEQPSSSSATALPGTPHVWLGVPMVAADHVIGVLALQSYTTQAAYGPDEIRLLSTIAASAAIVVENARLFEQISNLASDLERRVAERTTELASANEQLLEEKERLETVHAITLELTASLDLDEIIGRALEMASTNLGVARGSIMLRDTQTGGLVCRALLQDRGMVHSANLPINFENGGGLANWVIENKEAVCVGDVRLDSRWVLEAGRADEVRSVVAVPLITSDSTLGVLILSSPHVDYFAESQQRLLATIANEVAIAINNAQLYNYITEMASRLAELLEQQKEETSKSRSIFQSMTEGVIMLDTNERIAVLNPAAEHMLSISADQLVEQPLEMIQAQGETEEEQQRSFQVYDALNTGLQTAKEREGIYSMSFELPEPTQIIAVNFSPVMAFDGGVYGDVAVLRDITPEIEADRAKRQFISDVSHELRTPLTAIRGYVDLLLISARENLTEQQTEFLMVAKTNASRLMDLINDILDISRFEAGKIQLSFEQVDMAAIIQDVTQSLRLEAEKKHMTVKVEIAESLPTIEADQKRLTQVAFNLYSNAIKYTFDGGAIAVRAFLNPAGLMQIEVEDTGVGMSPPQLQKLFRPFYRADNPLRERSGGTGLGLLIAKSIVEEHGGEMWVTSELHKGSTFCFVLPLEQAKREVEE